jgi:hypothetical protein
MFRRLWLSLHAWLTYRAVRPWALATPILVLLIALPLLRPLRHPGQLSDDEFLLVQSVQSLVQDGDLELGSSAAALAPTATLVVNGGYYAAQPPVYAVLLGGVSSVLERIGISWSRQPDLHLYLLTLLGVTLPVALAAGILYRTGRLFELPRPKRALLAAAVVLGCGWISYATVLNPHAPAAALVVLAMAIVIRSSVARDGTTTLAWLPLGGLCAMLAATIDPAALLPLLALLIATLTLRLPRPRRLAAAGLFVVGTLPALALHAAWLAPITGDLLPPGPFHRDLLVAESWPDESLAFVSVAADEEELQLLADSSWPLLLQRMGRWITSTIGQHGLLSHFPVVVIAILGVLGVMHRHWPTHTKVLAGGSLAATVAMLAMAVVWPVDFRDAMFANRYLLATLPMLLLWAGAWLRRPHHPIAWTAAGLLLGFSVLVSLLGATGPTPPGGFRQWTPLESAERLVHPQAYLTRVVWLNQ